MWGKSRLGPRLIASTWHLHPQPIGTRRPTFLGLELLLGTPSPKKPQITPACRLCTQSRVEVENIADERVCRLCGCCKPQQGSSRIPRVAPDASSSCSVAIRCSSRSGLRACRRGGRLLVCTLCSRRKSIAGTKRLPCLGVLRRDVIGTVLLAYTSSLSSIKMPSSCRSKPVSSQNVLARTLASLGVHGPRLASPAPVARSHQRGGSDSSDIVHRCVVRRQSLWRIC